MVAFSLFLFVKVVFQTRSVTEAWWRQRYEEMQVFIALQVKHGNLPALSAHTTHSTIQHFWSNVHIQNTDFFLLLSTFHVPNPSNGLTDGCLSSPGLRGNPPQNKTKPKPTSQLKHLRLDGRSVSLQDNPKPGQVSRQWRTLTSLQGRSQYSEGPWLFESLSLRCAVFWAGIFSVILWNCWGKN